LSEWTSSDLQEEFLIPNSRAQGGEEDINSGGKTEWIRMSKLWEKEIRRT
jgi:hypothetical protein